MEKTMISKRFAEISEADCREACASARKLEDSGDYEAAAGALSMFWAGPGSKPTLDGLSDTSKAELLVRAGSVTGWLGGSRQIEGSQEKAKDLISEGIRMLEELGADEAVAEAQSDLGVCYWREGAFSEAEVFQNDALSRTAEGNPALRGKIMLRLVNVEISRTRYKTASMLLDRAQPLVESSGDNLLLGKLYFHRALVLNFLFEDEGNEEFSDRAIENYLSAERYYELAEHAEYQAVVDANLGSHLLEAGEYPKAHRYLDNAIKFFSKSENNGRLAKTFDTKARVYLEQGKLIEAEAFAKQAVQLLSEGDESAALSEALKTLGIILARQQLPEKARSAFDVAIEKALCAGDNESAGLATLSRIEELHEILTDDEKRDLFTSAERLLAHTERRTIIRRLAGARDICLNPGVDETWAKFNLTEAVHEFEAKYIAKALGETGGRVTKAADLLGITHQNLSLMLKRRHASLASIKKPRRQRSDRRKRRKSTRNASG